MTSPIIIHVPAVPVAQPRARAAVIAGQARIYNPSKHPVTAFKATVRMAFSEAYKGQPLTGPLRCDCLFVMPRPQSLRWKTRAMPRLPHTSKPDTDNLVKAVFDALNGIAFVDDSMIFSMSARKVIASGYEQPHAVISIGEYDPTTQEGFAEILSEQAASSDPEERDYAEGRAANLPFM